MSTPLHQLSPVLSAINSSLVALPAPTSISSWWNLGSTLMVMMMMQIMTGFTLALHYNSEVTTVFETLVRISTDVNYGYLVRSVHANGASMMFLLVYFHVGRGIYYGSSRLMSVWLVGVVLLTILLAVAFLGYVLPWGQMSFWGATVITNLISAIPYVGEEVVNWVWGSFSVGGVTLTRFYSLHYLLPLVLLVFGGLHLIMLHDTGSSNPVGVSSDFDKIPFHPYFSSKDMVGWLLLGLLLVVISLLWPWVLGDSENFLMADPMVTPTHIKPEWYFLFAYAILRAVPNKLGGVVGLAMSIFILAPLSFVSKSYWGMNHSVSHKLVFWLLVCSFCILTWIGGEGVEDPYVIIGQIASVSYFSSYLLWLVIW